MKEIADDNFEFDENGRKFSYRVENTVGKGEIACYEQFLLFQQCFQKAGFQGASKGVIVWEWVNPFPNKPWFLPVSSTSVLKTLWEKKKLLITSNFSFSHSVFYPFWDLSAIFIKTEIVVFKLFQIGKSKNCHLGKGSVVKMLCFSNRQEIKCNSTWNLSVKG